MFGLVVEEVVCIGKGSIKRCWGLEWLLGNVWRRDDEQFYKLLHQLQWRQSVSDCLNVVSKLVRLKMDLTLDIRPIFCLPTLDGHQIVTILDLASSSLLRLFRCPVKQCPLKYFFSRTKSISFNAFVFTTQSQSEFEMEFFFAPICF